MTEGRKPIFAAADENRATSAAMIKREIVDADGKIVGGYELHIALVPPEIVTGPQGQRPSGPIWTFNVNGQAGDTHFIIVMTTAPVDATDQSGLEIVGAELGKLLHGISHQIEAATLVAGSLKPGELGS